MIFLMILACVSIYLIFKLCCCFCLEKWNYCQATKNELPPSYDECCVLEIEKDKK